MILSLMNINRFFYGGGFFVIFFLIFFLILGVFIFTLIQNIRGWRKNNQSPRLSVEASVVTKRTQVYASTRRNTSVHSHHHGRTSYYATFQFESGDRLELPLNASDYGMLAEGDQGTLSFQGTRFLSFERHY